MSYKVMIIAGVLAGASGPVACQSQPKAPNALTSSSATTAWPRQLAGRQLAAVNDEYAIYADTEDAAEQLRAWTDAELVSFRDRYPELRVPRGAVFAIEPGEERAHPVWFWARENVYQGRQDVWASPPALGRPYSLFREPYFIESFVVPREQAINLLEAGNSVPEWICFLCTDAQIAHAFDRKLVKRRTGMAQRIKGARADSPPSEPAQSWWVGPFFYLVGETLYPKYRSIDVELMHLQRHETLWTALLVSAIEEPSDREVELRALRHRVGMAWERLWDRRPIE